MIRIQDISLPHGITLNCRVAGEAGRPVLLFLHGFPEAAFIWDETLAHFARPENGGFLCVAPHLRGFARSSSPQEPEAYRAKHLVQDLVALIDHLAPGAGLHALVAHDWGGAVAWNVANQQPAKVGRLAILNSPHPGTFLRELQHNPAQQAGSQYMHFLCRPDAEALLAANDFQRLFGFFNEADGKPPAWLTPEERERYREQWSQGLTGACNYYRASPLRPPREGDPAAQTITLPESMLHINVPTLVLWGMNDPALLPGLLQGLEQWIPQLQVQRHATASHWILHEDPAWVRDQLQPFLLSK